MSRGGFRYVAPAVRLGAKLAWSTVRSVGRRKVFCIGCNKTGTTSLEAALDELGFPMGNQVLGERIADTDWGRRDFRKLIWFCRTARAFQDAPFSFPYTFVALDQAFPGSRFVLTVRDSSEDWYQSITRFHAKMWGRDGEVPAKEDLQNAQYHYRGQPWKTNRLLFMSPEDDPYRKEDLICFYETHNRSVKEYFRHRPKDLLVLNVGTDGAYARLCDFVGRTPCRDEFPWQNRT